MKTTSQFHNLLANWQKMWRKHQSQILFQSWFENNLESKSQLKTNYKLYVKTIFLRFCGVANGWALPSSPCFSFNLNLECCVTGFLKLFIIIRFYFKFCYILV